MKKLVNQLINSNNFFNIKKNPQYIFPTMFFNIFYKKQLAKIDI